MVCTFSSEDIRQIAATLRGATVAEHNGWSIEQRASSGALEQLVTIYPRIPTPAGEIALITVQSRQGYYQLFGCTDYMVIEPDEVLFIARNADRASCMLISAGRTCTLYADVPLELLRVPIDALDPALLLSVMQLALAEHRLLVDANDR
ncbi:MAG: hypothetical protein N2971_00430 [Chlorobi bacterium]|nr:hypothetical protein [Chlorobiota bacterium]